MFRLNDVFVMYKKPILAAVTISVIAVFAWYLSTHEFVHEEIYPQSRNIRYSFTLQNKTNKLLENVNFRVFGPVKKTSFQLTKKITATLPFNLETDKSGNQILVFKIKRLPPYASQVITINATLNFSRHPNTVKLEEKGKYLAEERYVEISDKRLIARSKKLTVDKKIDTAEKILNWVAANIKYSGYIKDDRGALYALKYRKGDCTEYMYLYNALARIAGIPARGIGGFVYSENAVLRPENYHNWSEIYLNGAWRIVDPQNKKFMENESSFIAMRIISVADNSTINVKNTQQFAVSDKNILVKMQSIQ